MLNRKRRILFIFLILAIFSVVSLIIYSCNDKELLLSDFSEKDLSFFVDLSQDEKENITAFLDDYYFETDDESGFIVVEGSYNIYPVYELVEFLTAMDKVDILQSLKPILADQLYNIDIHELNTLELYYFLKLADFADFVVDEDELLVELNNKYDQANHLLYVYSIEDILSTKLNISYLIYKDFNDEYNLSGLSLTQGIIDYYEEYQFSLPQQGKTLYNSGGDILVVLDELGLGNLINYSEAYSWFCVWMDEYEDFDFGEAFSIIIYRDFINVKSIFFDISEDIDYLNSAYSQMSLSLFENSSYLALAEVVSAITLSENSDVSKHLNDISSTIESESVRIILYDFSLSNTFYGVMLAEMCDYDINIRKINNLLDNYDQVLYENITADLKAKLLYFQIMIRDLVSENYEYNRKMIEIELRKIIKSVIEDENVSRKIISLRYVVEIYAFLHINMDRSSYDKIKNSIIDISHDRLDILIRADYDIYIIDHLMQTDVLSQNDFFSDLSFFSINNGFRESIYMEEPDIITTNNVYRIIDDVYCTDEYFNANRLFAERLMVMPGIYSDVEHGTVSLKTIYFGNIIKYASW